VSATWDQLLIFGYEGGGTIEGSRDLGEREKRLQHATLWNQEEVWYGLGVGSTSSLNKVEEWD
jgi:hypothetical protein